MKILFKKKGLISAIVKQTKKTKVVAQSFYPNVVKKVQKHKEIQSFTVV